MSELIRAQLIEQTQKIAEHGSQQSFHNIQKRIETIVNLEALLNLLKQSKYILEYLKDDYLELSDQILDLEASIKEKIINLREK